ncbi:MFS transporter [Solirubrobacter soli]|uniref:MFS transporter n=1 Tax=Solirubrobacter soli TaxID=363832 RepID=UPI00069FC5B6|nr:MFS transporter [Solirubrobacter soli]
MNRPDPRRWKALAVVLAAGFMTLLDVSIVNVALPSIEQSLHAQQHALQWIVAGYALALGLMLVPAGRFGDAHGRRPVFMAGVALFVVASVASALAPTTLWLVSMRLVQGFAGGLISPQISGLIQSLFRGEERGKAFGLFGSVIAVSTAVGPLVGGALIELFGVHDGWRAVFFVNLPIGAAILLSARRYLPAPTTAERQPQSLDPLGVVLLGAAVVSILVPFIEQRAWHSPFRVALLPLGVVLLLVWVLHERRFARTHEPLVSLELFRIRSYVLGAPVGLLYFGGFIAVFFILTQYLQLGLGYPAWKSGLSATPFAIGGALVASAGSRQVLRRGPKLVAFGLATFLVGMAGVWLAVGAHPGDDVAVWMALPLLIAGLGGGLVISPNLTLTLSRVPVERAGSAGGLLQTGQRIGSAAGIAITGSIFYNQLASSHGDYALAFRHGIISIAAFAAAALALVLADAVTYRS